VPDKRDTVLCVTRRAVILRDERLWRSIPIKAMHKLSVNKGERILDSWDATSSCETVKGARITCGPFVVPEFGKATHGTLHVVERGGGGWATVRRPCVGDEVEIVIIVRIDLTMKLTTPQEPLTTETVEEMVTLKDALGKRTRDSAFKKDETNGGVRRRSDDERLDMVHNASALDASELADVSVANSATEESKDVASELVAAQPFADRTPGGRAAHRLADNVAGYETVGTIIRR
jgi:hypothetical protein